MLNYLYTFLFLLSLVGCSTAEKYLEAQRPERNWKVIWSKNLDPVYESGNLPIALNSPNIYRGLLYAGHNSGKMIAYDLENGREIWTTDDNGVVSMLPEIFP